MFTSPYRFDYCTSTVIAWSIPYYKSTSLVLAGIIRKEEPFKGKLSAPGGFKDAGETLEQCAIREMKEETGAFVDPRELKLVAVQSDPNRDPRSAKTGVPVIDHFYQVWMPLSQMEQMKAGDDAAELKLITYHAHDITRGRLIQEWAFDHGDSIWRFMKQIHWLRPDRNVKS